MGKRKQSKNTKSIIGYAALCIAFVVFLVAVVIGAYNQKSDLVTDTVLAKALGQYFDKAPRKITQEDLDSIAFFSLLLLILF